MAYIPDADGVPFNHDPCPPGMNPERESRIAQAFIDQQRLGDAQKTIAGLQKQLEELQYQNLNTQDQIMRVYSALHLINVEECAMADGHAGVVDMHQVRMRVQHYKNVAAQCMHSIAELLGQEHLSMKFPMSEKFTELFWSEKQREKYRPEQPRSR